MLLAIDEYEVFDRKIAQGVLPEALLATIRESIRRTEKSRGSSSAVTVSVS